MTTARDRRFERLARIEKWRSQFTWSVVRPTTFRGNVAETVVAFKELAVVARRAVLATVTRRCAVVAAVLLAASAVWVLGAVALVEETWAWQCDYLINAGGQLSCWPRGAR